MQFLHLKTVFVHIIIIVLNLHQAFTERFSRY